MAFDMYAKDRHEAIHNQDEYIFSFASEAPHEFPQLNALWSKFYSDFNLYPEQAAALVHELLALHARYGPQGGKGMALLVLRLAQFFSAAACAKIGVRCAGD